MLVPVNRSRSYLILSKSDPIYLFESIVFFSFRVRMSFVNSTQLVHKCRRRDICAQPHQCSVASTRAATYMNTARRRSFFYRTTEARYKHAGKKVLRADVWDLSQHSTAVATANNITCNDSRTTNNRKTTKGTSSTPNLKQTQRQGQRGPTTHTDDKEIVLHNATHTPCCSVVYLLLLHEAY